jgi:hypothetical protein
LVGQALAGLRIQHPLRDSQLQITGQSDNQNCRVHPPQMANYLDFCAMQRMMAIADLRQVQIMSIMRMPYGMPSLFICWNPALTCARFNC